MLFMAVESRWIKSGILLQIEKATESSDGGLACHLFSLKHVVVHAAINNPSRILTIEK